MRKLWSLGLQASLEEVVTVGAAIQYRAGRAPARARRIRDRIAGDLPPRRRFRPAHRQRHRRAAEAADRGRDRRPRRLRLRRAADATQAVLAGAEMIAAGRDRTFPAADGEWPGTGAIVAALEYATERDRADRRQARSADLRDGARPARPRPRADGRRPAGLRPGGRRGRRARRGDRAHRRHHREQAEAAERPRPGRDRRRPALARGRA